MAEIVIGAILIAVIAYTTGFFTGQYVSRRRAERLKRMYLEAILGSAYVNAVVRTIQEQRNYPSEPPDEEQP